MPQRKKIRRKIRYAFVYLLVQFLIITSNLIPRILWLKICGVLGRMACALSGKSQKRVIKHLSIAFPEKKPQQIEKLSRQVFEFLGKNAGEMLRATRVRNHTELQKFMITHG